MRDGRVAAPLLPATLTLVQCDRLVTGAYATCARMGCRPAREAQHERKASWLRDEGVTSTACQVRARCVPDRGVSSGQYRQRECTSDLGSPGREPRETPNSRADCRQAGREADVKPAAPVLRCGLPRDGARLGRARAACLLGEGAQRALVDVDVPRLGLARVRRGPAGGGAGGAGTGGLAAPPPPPPPPPFRRRPPR